MSTEDEVRQASNQYDEVHPPARRCRASVASNTQPFASSVGTNQLLATFPFFSGGEELGSVLLPSS